MAAPLLESTPQYYGREHLDTARAFSHLYGHANNPFLHHEPYVTYTDGAAVSYTVTSVLDPEETPFRILTAGFCGVEEAYMDLANEQALNGETVVTFRAARHQGLSSLAPRNLLHPNNLLAHEVVAIADGLHNTYGVEEIDISGHSMGGPAAVRAAEIISRRSTGVRVGRVTLMQSAGVTRHNLGRLGVSLPAIGLEALPLIARHPELVRSTLVHINANLLRTSGEMIEVSHCRLSPERLERLNESGIATAAIFNYWDMFFPAHKAIREIGDAVDQFGIGRRGGHLAPLTHPNDFARDLWQADNQALALPFRLVTS